MFKFSGLRFALFLMFFCMVTAGYSQGCSDAGFCTIGNFNDDTVGIRSNKFFKNEIDLSFIYGTHGKYQRFYQPQINYRRIMNNGSFIELRLPLNIATDRSSGITTTGIGDAIITYNNKFKIKKALFRYSAGLRVSFSDASKGHTFDIYPMYLQSGLGTTDILAVINFDSKYLSISSGVQLPVIQYNRNEQALPLNNQFVYAYGFRRMADGLLKLTGHLNFSKLKLSGGLLSIFHFADDNYYYYGGKLVLPGSKGVTLNIDMEATYPLSKKIKLNFLFAEPIITRKNIPDGLARSRVYAPKITFIL